MTPGHRLRSSTDLRRVLRHGRSVARPEFVMYYSERAEPAGPRFAFVVSKRVGGAVVRNRVKRLLRESARSLADRLRPVDIVIVARQPIVGVRYADLDVALREAAARCGLTAPPRRETTESTSI